MQAAATEIVAAAPPAATAVAVAASPIAATAVAAIAPLATSAAEAASTAIAAAPPVATALASPSPLAMIPVQIVGMGLDSSGPTLTIRNTSGQTIDLADWRLYVGEAAVTVPEDARLAPGEALTLHFASGPDTANDLYLGDQARTLAQGVRPGATVQITNEDGQTMLRGTIPSA
ncbi:MAG: lamin tail domain-containing protein [Chloroflexi bacterium]|nr:lamin tail domain-containing protein [Chloroflexota bacterium]